MVRCHRVRNAGDSWTPPNTHEGIDAWHVDDMKYFAELPMDASVKKEFLKRVGRWMDVGKVSMHRAVDGDGAFLDQIVREATPGREGTLEGQSEFMMTGAL